MADLQDELHAAGEAGELDTPPDTPTTGPGNAATGPRARSP
nr:hypothetical protein [Streptomyces sp. LBUM 1477]